MRRIYNRLSVLHLALVPQLAGRLTLQHRWRRPIYVTLSLYDVGFEFTAQIVNPTQAQAQAHLSTPSEKLKVQLGTRNFASDPSLMN